MHSRRIKNNWHIIKGQPLTELDKKVLYYQNKGHLVPPRKLIKTAEQIEGIRRSSVVNTGVLDLVAREIKAGMSTAEIDKLVYDYTVSHGAIPAPLNYEGFPKSVCTSVNEVVCHGIPSEDAGGFYYPIRSSDIGRGGYYQCRCFDYLGRVLLGCFPYVYYR